MPCVENTRLMGLRPIVLRTKMQPRPQDIRREAPFRRVFSTHDTTDAVPETADAIAESPSRRICFPNEGFNVSGGIRIICEVANGLAARGHAVRIIVPDYQSTPPFPLDSAVQIDVITTKGTGLRRKIDYISQLSRRAALDSDICIATGSRTPYYIFLSCLFTRTRPKLAYLIQHYEVVSHAEQTSHAWPVRKLLAFAIGIGYHLPFRQVAVSHWIKEQLGRPACAVIPNGVDTEIFHPGDTADNAKFTIGVIESSAKWKGYADFLAAINGLPDSEKQSLCIRIASREEVALPAGIESQRLKPTSDAAMADFYRGCDVFVFTSHVEGYGLPPLEAMSCGIPAIVTDCGGVREYADAENCVLIPVGDANALQNAILHLKNNTVERSKLREQGRITALQFTLPAMQQQYADWIAAL